MIFVKMSLQNQNTVNRISFPFQNVTFQDNISLNIITERNLHYSLYIVNICPNIHIYI